ncbi:MAG: hypothetical protein UHD09_00650, partial [Bifidobacterium sp.]|nr:hypothetical protein [Bifidobacterium sp.]
MMDTTMKFTGRDADEAMGAGAVAAAGGTDAALADEALAGMTLKDARPVPVNRRRRDWRGWKFMAPFALVFVFVFIIP